MKDYLLMSVSFIGYFVVFFTVELCENTITSQILVGIGFMMMFLPIPIDLMFDMHEENKKEKQ